MKFLYGYFHPDTGQSIVALANKNGIYTGEARLHPEDKQYASKFAGCRLAEARAWMKFLSAEIRRKKIMLHTVQNLNRDIQKHCKDINPEVQHRINLKLRDYTKEIKELTENIAEIKKQIAEDIKRRDDINNIIKRSKSNKESN